MEFRVDNGEVSVEGPSVSAVEVEFADGKFRVHEAIVAHLGGTKALEDNKGMFRQKTYEQFIIGFRALVAKKTIESALQGVIRNHLDNFGI